MPRYTRIIRRTESSLAGWMRVIEESGKAERRKKERRKRERVSIGIDPSLSGTGLSVFYNGTLTDFQGWTEIKTLQKKEPKHLIHFKPKETTAAARLGRIRLIGNWIASVVGDFVDYDTIVAIEGYAFAARARSISDLHELGGYIRQALLTLGVPFRIYDPTSLKLAATGDGGADKGTMKVACLKRLDLDVTSYGKAGENIADAALLGWLLEQERAIRDGRVDLKKAPKDVRAVLLRTTKTQPEALISQPWISEDVIKLPAVSYA